MDKRRVRKINEKEDSKGTIIYWMSRDQRVHYNWGLKFAIEKSKELNSPLKVVFCLVPTFYNATSRHYNFMIKGLKEVEHNLNERGVRFEILEGDPQQHLPQYLKKHNAGVLITDFDPLKLKTQWKNTIKDKINISFYEVDAHNIVPCWLASDKKEFSAYTLRRKLRHRLDEFMDDFTLPSFKKVKNNNNWNKILKNNMKELDWIKPGESEAKKVLNDFIKNKLEYYSREKNDPNKDYVSNLSPYLHFGQISSQYVVKKVLESNMIQKEPFIEEIFVRKELADNFCHYEKNYDNFKGFHEWAQKTLNEHRNDKREYIYSLKELENYKTHDRLWNTAQKEMVIKGKMHGFMRMYWAKKILEWSRTPEEALRNAIYLNNKYELDGRDPNGYTGIAWSIGGIHDRAWTERKVFGKVRYMNYNGCKRKFDVEKYIRKMNSL